MRRISSLLIALISISITAAVSQTISVESFAEEANDMDARINMVKYDQNNRKAALIKIETIEKGFYFDVGQLGVVGVLHDQTAETWVYIPQGAIRMDIKHASFGSCRYEFNIPIRQGTTYRMKLFTEGKDAKKATLNAGGQYLILKTNPAECEVTIDGGLARPISGGSINIFLENGPHTYSVRAPLYHPQSGSVKISNERVEQIVNLEPNFAKVTLKAATPQTQIYINERLKGEGLYEDNLSEGIYIVTSRLKGHHDSEMRIDVKDNTPQSITLDAPTPIYGALNVNSNIVDTKVYLDGELLGKAPNVFYNILACDHELTLKQDGYAPHSRNITIREDKIEMVDIVMQETKMEVKKDDKNNPLRKMALYQMGYNGQYNYLNDEYAGLYNTLHGAMVAVSRKNGAYAKILYGKKSSEYSLLEGYSFNYYDCSLTSFSATAGYIRRISKEDWGVASYYYIGAGLDKQVIMWDAATEFTKATHYSVAVDLGVAANLLGWTISMNLYSTNLKNYSFNIGTGFCF